MFMCVAIFLGKIAGATLAVDLDVTASVTMICLVCCHLVSAVLWEKSVHLSAATGNCLAVSLAV